MDIEEEEGDWEEMKRGGVVGSRMKEEPADKPNFFDSNYGHQMV